MYLLIAFLVVGALIGAFFGHPILGAFGGFVLLALLCLIAFFTTDYSK